MMNDMTHYPILQIFFWVFFFFGVPFPPEADLGYSHEMF